MGIPKIQSNDELPAGAPYFFARDRNDIWFFQWTKKRANKRII